MYFINEKIEKAVGIKEVALVLKNCNVVNVFSNEVVHGDLAVDGDIIIGMGNYIGKTEIDLKGKYVAPGFIDSHVHIESSMVSPKEFARAVISRGTTTTIVDPHEIANVCGINGIKYMMEETEDIPLNVFFMLSSCVPATNFETSGAILRAEDLKELIEDKRVLGLGEMMNYPGVINRDKEVMDKLSLAQNYNKIVDGHAPTIKGNELNAYSISGIKTDHECSDLEEMNEKIRNGMYIAIREGSAAKNLETLIKGVNSKNERRIMFCADDRHPDDILKLGHMDNCVRRAIGNGIDAIAAIRMATLNAAECYKLDRVGAIAPSYKADLVILEDLKNVKVDMVIKDGKIVFNNNRILMEIGKKIDISKVINTVNIQKVTIDDFRLKLNKEFSNIISVSSNSIGTKNIERKINTDNGEFKCELNDGINKIAVIERHKKSGRIGLGLVENFGLKMGAIASTVAHDSHNIIVLGSNDEDMMKAVNELERVGGGITVSLDGKIIDTLELEIAGLMSSKSMEYVAEKVGKMIAVCHEILGVNKDVEPFMTLAFLALPVLPEIRITDRGVFDVLNFKFLNI
ncbi:adenine deaminase [Clostridium felsineum]|uniref:adenine deaminase n=1 Tax=Clostridium felsineum TaxID=36839 RepID=UPI00098C3886|nr:adenine deaminase [Clostridium felsineum]URZ01471.1 Adenine deaminase [Clostridium felsineum]